MRNIKRDILIICIMLFSMLHGCFYKSDVLNEKPDVSSVYIDKNYIETNLDLIFSFLKDDKYEKAEEITNIFKTLELDTTYEKMLNLAFGIINLRKKNISVAKEYFSNSLPLIEGEIGIATCLLLTRNASSLEDAKIILQENSDFTQSNLYHFFNRDFYESLKLYYEFWSEPEEDYYSRLDLFEKKILFKANPLIEEFLENIYESGKNIVEEFEIKE
ncbi:MAG: hypothetical protein M0R46_05270 [Candidatus Muirbacterium halophilum]|nr:hypothetical protein [Candidatus Muirbacterium halophilum]MCK9475305.1 hypothetical protein [Candidatus Muirbacterium halophilum]